MQQIDSSKSSFIKNEPKNHSQMVTGESRDKIVCNAPSSFKNKIQKGRQSRFAFERVLNFDYCILLFCMMNIILSLLYCDADYKGKANISKWCLNLTDPITIVEIFVTIFRYKAQVKLEISQKILQENDGVISSGKLHQIIIETFLLMIQPYSFLNDIFITSFDIFANFTFDFKLNYVLVVLGFLKLFIALRVLLLRQIYLSPRSSRLCRMYGCQSDYLYAVKCLFKDSPISFILVVFAASILMFAACLRIAERNLIVQYPKNLGIPAPFQIQSFINAIWLTIITMTTVGYGDYYPRTVIGRLIDVVLVIWGTFIVSIMVVALTNTLNMDQSQKRALIVLNRLESKKSLKQAAAYLITHYCKRYLVSKRIREKKRLPLTQSEQAQTNQTFYKYLSNFQSVHRQIRSMYEIDDIYEEMSRQFESINEQITQLLETQQTAIGNLKEYVEQKQKQKLERVERELLKKNQMKYKKDVKSASNSRVNEKLNITKATNSNRFTPNGKENEKGKSRFDQQNQVDELQF